MRKSGYNIFFDASQLALWQMAPNHRTGIGRMSCNTLKALLERDDTEVWLVFPAGKRSYGEKFIAAHSWAAKADFVSYPLHANPGLCNGVKFFARCYLGKIMAVLPSPMQSAIKRLLRRRPYAVYDAADEDLRLAVIEKMKPGAVNIWFSPNQPIPESVEQVAGLQKYVVLHDIIPLRLPGKHPGFDPTLDLMKQHLRKADIIWANSNFTRMDFLDYFPSVEPGKVKVAYHGGSEDLSCKDRPGKIPFELPGLPLNAPYFVTLGALEPRKGLSCVLKAFEKFRKKYPDAHLIMIGPKGWDYTSIILGAMRGKNIHRTGYLDDDAVFSLLGGAVALIYMSEYEGFGLPVVEAMASGCPVIAANASALPEIGEKAAAYVRSGDSTELADMMERLHLNPQLRNDLSEAGTVRARKFTWSSFANAILEEAELRKSEYSV